MQTSRAQRRVEAADLDQLTRQIEHARGAGVDFLVGSPPLGLEHELYPIPEQLELAHHLAELGVDAVLGHHPHVLQPMELYRTRRDPRRLVPIYYSLGNLINPFTAPDSCRSGVAHEVPSVPRSESPKDTCDIGPRRRQWHPEVDGDLLVGQTTREARSDALERRGQLAW